MYINFKKLSDDVVTFNNNLDYSTDPSIEDIVTGMSLVVETNADMEGRANTVPEVVVAMVPVVLSYVITHGDDLELFDYTYEKKVSMCRDVFDLLTVNLLHTDLYSDINALAGFHQLIILDKLFGRDRRELHNNIKYYMTRILGGLEFDNVLVKQVIRTSAMAGHRIKHVTDSVYKEFKETRNPDVLKTTDTDDIRLYREMIEHGRRTLQIAQKRRLA